MSLPSTLSLGSVEGYNLNLISGITTTDGKTYYYWDRNGDGTANSADRIRYNDQYILDNLFNNGQLSEDDGQQIIAGADTSRSVLVGDYTVVLPTYSELQELYEGLLDLEFDKANFRKKILSLNILEDTKELQRDVPHRPGKLYQFNETKQHGQPEKNFAFDL